MMTSALPIELSQDSLAIVTRRLTKRYAKTAALVDVNLQVPAGAVYLLLGPNGAGKSTTIKILLDLLRATGGEAYVFGMKPDEQQASVRANVGYVPERLDWGFGWMRVGRLLEHHAAYYPSWDAAYAKRLCVAFGLNLDQAMGTLSKGQSRRVHLTMALAHRPPLLVLDEPTDGLDPVMRDETLSVLSEHLADAPTTVLLCTHHVGEVERLADHIGVMRDGVLQLQVPLDSLRAELRRYRAIVPTGWQGAAMFGDAVIRRITSHNELDWTVWGNPAEIGRELEMAGAAVREAAPLSLEDATLALLSNRGRSL
jgi:ABC-2 type transport system ATP-binding protein